MFLELDCVILAGLLRAWHCSCGFPQLWRDGLRVPCQCVLKFDAAHMFCEMVCACRANACGSFDAAHMFCREGVDECVSRVQAVDVFRSVWRAA